MSDPFLALETARNQVSYTLNRKDLSTSVRNQIRDAIACMDSAIHLFYLERGQDQPNEVRE